MSDTTKTNEGTMLSKNSSEQELRDYFQGVFNLYQSNEKFPINLDDVWSLVYSGKNKAVRALKMGFVVEEDYICLTQIGQTATGGYRKDVYMLSVNCMEYFIAKKVRQVFNVYREVFKKVATGEVKVVQENPHSTSELEILVKSAQALLEQSKRLDNVEQRLNEIDRERQENSRLLLSAEISTEKLPEESESAKIRKLVHLYVKSTGMSYEDVWNNIYETLEYRYGNRIRAYKKIPSDKSLLDVAIRNNLGQKVFNVISDMVRAIKH